MALLRPKCLDDLIDSEEDFSTPPQTIFSRSYSRSSAKKKQQYSANCSVVLIPSRQEYIEAGINLWTSKHDQVIAQSEVATEVKQILDYNPRLSFQMAMKFLYQPSILDFEDDQMSTEDANSSSPGKTCSSRTSLSSFSSPSLSERYFSDSKERLNILLVHRSTSAMEDIRNDIRQALVPYQRWVISFKYAESEVEAMEMLFKSNNVVSKLDVVLVHECILDALEDHDDAIDVKTLVTDMRAACDSNTLIGLLLDESRSKHEEYKEMAKKGGIDFMWKKWYTPSIHMLPLLLTDIAEKKSGKSPRSLPPTPPSGADVQKAYV